MKRRGDRRMAVAAILGVVALASLAALRWQAAAPGSPGEKQEIALAGSPSPPMPAMPSPDRPTPPAALGPDPVEVARRPRGEITSGLAQQAAEDYRRRARYPHSSRPL